MQHWIKCTVAASVMLSGCSMFQAPEQQQAEQRRLSTIAVPQGLQQPNQPGEFDIPTTSAPLVNTDARSPVLVLATAASSRVEEGDRAVRVWFDRSDITGDLVPFLQQMLTRQFSEQSIALTAQDDAALVYHTDWVTRETETGFWFWSDVEQSERARFQVAIEPKPHGRSASIVVSMLEHQYFDESGALSTTDVKRHEAALLNQIIDRIGKEEIVLAAANKSRAPDVSLEPGMDAQGNPALLTTQSLESAWSQLESLFTQLNLKVTDRNRSTYTYYLSYEKEDPGLWSRIWGAEAKPELPIAQADYQMVLSRSNNQTAISLRDKDGAALDVQTVLALHEPFVQAVRLAQIEL